jgi:hypothetical protein
MQARASLTRYLEKFKINISTRRIRIHTKHSTRNGLSTKNILHIRQTHAYRCTLTCRTISGICRVIRSGTPELGGRGSRPPCPLPGGARGEKVPFQFKGLPWRNSELSEMLVKFFYEFASENARNAAQSPGGEPLTPLSSN